MYKRVECYAIKLQTTSHSVGQFKFRWFDSGIQKHLNKELKCDKKFFSEVIFCFKADQILNTGWDSPVPFYRNSLGMFFYFYLNFISVSVFGDQRLREIKGKKFVLVFQIHTG